jgi:sugar (pentulose or hexulose) kinase
VVWALAGTDEHGQRQPFNAIGCAERFGWPTDGHAGLDVRRLTIVGGGTKGALWRQIKADVTGLPVRVPTSVETTATGAAILTAVGAGVHASVAEAVAAFVDYQPDEHVPDPERHQLYSSAYHRYREVYALKPVFEKVET